MQSWTFIRDSFLTSRRRAGGIPWILGALLLSLPVTTSLAQTPEDEVFARNQRCQECHGRPHIAELDPQERLSMVGIRIGATPAPETAVADASALRGDEPAVRPELYVVPGALGESVHVTMACVECHEDAEQLPHAPRLNRRSCARSCHEDAFTRYEEGAHALIADSEVKAPGCATCHGSHDVRPAGDRASLTHPLRMVEVCAECHGKQTGKTTNGDSHSDRVHWYTDSIHGAAVLGGGLVSAATCAACHENHRVLPANDERSAVHRANIPSTCGQCHIGVAETYETSIHGLLFAEDDDRAPSCVDCHSAHGISSTERTLATQDIIAECGECHDDENIANGFRLTFYESYLASYHGQVTQLGSMRAARCSDCHGSHDILPLDHPDSRVSEEHLIATCQTCHPSANASFVRYDPHADYRDRERYPVLFGIWIYFIIVMSSAFGFFGLHTILWFGRSVIERIKHGPRKHFAHQKTAIRRFRLINRINHALTVCSFFGLTTTGIPLLFADHPWARPFVNVFGGVEMAGVWHRAFAVMLIINGICFFSWLASSAVTRTCSLRQWLFGPTSLVPCFKDFKDCAGMFLWFFRGGRKPAFERWTYWEKFDFWCEIGGTAIIGGSGLLLWFPTFFSMFLPGWIFNAATVVHGFEALLAIGFIFTIHFFNANLRLEKFPVDDVMVTGHLPEEELAEERPMQYERIKKSGRLEELRNEAPPSWQRKFAILVGVALMAYGLMLITLIVLAGLDVI